MRDACLRAIELGLPAVTFTDHADLTTLVVSDAAAEYIRAVGGQVDGNLYRPPPLDVDGYLDCVQRCRAEFAGQLPIAAGVELGRPALASGGGRGAGCRRVRAHRRVGTFPAPPGWRHGYRGPLRRHARRPGHKGVPGRGHRPGRIAGRVRRPSSHQLRRRYWPVGQGEYSNADFEGEYRTALRALARSGRGLWVRS